MPTVNDGRCVRTRQELGVYVLGAMEHAQRAQVDSHLAACSWCREELAGLAAERVLGLPFAALSGSKVQLEQVVKLSTFGRAIVLTDPDLAGDAAAERLCREPAARLAYRIGDVGAARRVLRRVAMVAASAAA